MNGLVDTLDSESLRDVTRFEIIDHTPCKNCTGQGGTEGVLCHVCSGLGVKGREVVFWDRNKKIESSIQDDGKTLKIFINERE